MRTDDGADILARNRRFLLGIAGLGGLLYGIDVGVIAGALPYLEATAGFTAGQLSLVVAAVLLGSVLSTAVAGGLADLLGRRTVMVLGGGAFVASIPMIALSHGFGALVLGRILQGLSAGLVGVVVPLYLAECLGAAERGKGTGLFQGLLTLGICAAAVVAFLFSIRIGHLERAGGAAGLLAFKDAAWRSIFWVSLLPGVLFTAGSQFVPESPRWLFRRGDAAGARAALLRTRTAGQAELELREMGSAQAPGAAQGTLLRRNYVLPFLLACAVLVCTQATGANSILGYHATLLIQAGLGDAGAHLGYVALTVVNVLMTLAGVFLVDRLGRKVLLAAGSAGIVVALLALGLVFRATERRRVDCRAGVQALVGPDQALDLPFDGALAQRLAPGAGPRTLQVIYAYGGFRAASPVLRSGDPGARLRLTRESCVPRDFWAAVAARLSNPMADAAAARRAPLRIEHALVTPVPGRGNGWLVAGLTLVFIAFFALGPGVCVWLALSELMPTRIRSNGMSVALLLNQGVSTGIAAAFLPVAGRHGHAAVFFGFAGCTVVLFLIAALLLPETKGKTLEEIEKLF